MRTTWNTEWETITKGQEFTCETSTKEVVKGTVDYVLQNSLYSLIVLTNGVEYVLYTKKYLSLNK